MLIYYLYTVYFPSQKLFYFFIPVIIVLGLFLSVRDRFQVKNNQDSVIVVAQSNSVREKIEEKDLNNNGIEDWKEQLPLKNASTTDNLISINKIGESENLTESISKDLLYQYVNIKGSGGYSTAGADNITYDIVNKITSNSVSRDFTEKDLNINPISDSASVKNYANSLAQIRNLYFTLYKSDQFVFTSYDDPSFLEKMERASEYYSKMTKEILALSVPMSLTPSHLLIIKNYSESSNALKNFSFMNTDPAKAIQGINAYLKLQGQEQVILKNIAEYLRQNGIIFLSNEAGSFWNTL